jgi:hypothetical protein
MEWKKDVHFLIIVTKLLKILKNSKQKKLY